MPLVWQRRRHRSGRRGGRRSRARRRGGDLTEAADLLRPAVDAALAAANDGLVALPPVQPPAGLRRYLGFKRLSGAAVRAITRLMDHDEEFRARVASAVDEDTVGRAAWLWLARPEGWEAEYDELRRDADSTAHAASDKRDERDARRRLARTRAAAERSAAIATAREQEVAGARAELVDERARRRLLESRVAELESELAQTQEERAAAVRQLKQVEVNLARRVAEVKDAKARLLEQQRGQEPAAEAEVDLRSHRHVDPVRLHPALQEAVDSAARLSAALTALEELTDAGAGRRAEPPSSSSEPSLPTGKQTRKGPRPADQPGAAQRRVVRSLPGGMRDDSVEAVDHLLRNHGAVLAVDGYNVSMVGWPEFPVSEQRRRLVTALADTAARTGAQVEVIFDGAEIDPVGVPRAARQLVCVRFSPAGIEADDVLLDLVSQLPPARPVVVASSDNRVRDGARRLGANLVHARQLVAVLRR